MDIQVVVAKKVHAHFSSIISKMIAHAARQRGTGIAERTPSYISKKITEGLAIIALLNEKVIGFCYIESWQNKTYVANSGLVVHPDFRNAGLAKKIKETAFLLSRTKFPNANLFGITTSPAVMKINTELGYKPVSYAALTKDETFWQGCKSCKNFDILKRTNKTMCLCTGMLHTNNTAHSKERLSKEKISKEKNLSTKEY